MRKVVREAIMAASDEINGMLVPKSGYNAHHDYRFVSIDDLYRDIVPVIRRHGLSWTVRMLNKQLIGDNVEFDVEIDLHWKDGTTYAAYDEFFLILTYIGAQTAGAAKSYASKAFLREEFKVATGEPDADEQRRPTRQGARDFLDGVQAHAWRQQGRDRLGPSPGGDWRDGREEPPPPSSPQDYGATRVHRPRPAGPDSVQRLDARVAEMRDRKDEARAIAEDRERAARIAEEIKPHTGPAPLSLAERDRFERTVFELIDRMKDDMSVRRVWHSRSRIIARWEQDDPDRYRRVLDRFREASAKFGKPAPQDRPMPRFHRPPGREPVQAAPRSNVVKLVPGDVPAQDEPPRRLRRIDKDPEQC